MSRHHANQYASLGVTVIENALPTDIADSAREQFISTDYDHIQQERRRYFAHALRDETPHLPSANEVYTAEFWRSRFLETGDFIQGLYNDKIKPLVSDVAGKTLTKIELRAYKLMAGGHFRVHIDDYLGDVGFIWYLSKGWKWDWGGLLITIDGEATSTTIPKFNQMAVINHGMKRLPHFVTEVSKNALEPRYMLVGFGS